MHTNIGLQQKTKLAQGHLANLQVQQRLKIHGVSYDSKFVSHSTILFDVKKLEDLFISNIV